MTLLTLFRLDPKGKKNAIVVSHVYISERLLVCLWRLIAHVNLGCITNFSLSSSSHTHTRTALAHIYVWEIIHRCCLYPLYANLSPSAHTAALALDLSLLHSCSGGFGEFKVKQKPAYWKKRKGNSSDPPLHNTEPVTWRMRLYIVPHRSFNDAAGLCSG